MPLSNPKLHDRDFIYEEYVLKQKAAEDIAQDVGCTKHGIYHALKRFDIPRRVHSSKYPQLNDKEWLHKMYEEQLLSTKQIANLIGSTVGNVGSHLVTAGITLRSSKDGWKARFPDGRSGENTSNWRGGISTENNLIRSSQEYKLWRTAVFERDDYTCVFCGARNGNGVAIVLHADHIKPFAYFPELRFAIDNGRTLCIDCHRKTDTFGRMRKKDHIA